MAMLGFSNDAEKMVTVARFLDPMHAQIAKGLLESAGIECFLQGEHANHMVPLAFRVRLQVTESDEGEARELLQSAGDGDRIEGEDA